MCVLVGFLILFLPPGSQVIAMLGALCDGICDTVCISDLSDFIYTGCWKASICSFTWSHWRRELYRKDHRPQDRTFSKFDISYKTTQAAFSWFQLQFYHSGVCICLHLPMNRTSLLPVIRSCLNKQQISTPTLGAFASWVIIVDSSKLEYVHVLIQQAVLWVSVQSVGLLRDFTSSHCIPKHGLLFS